MLGIKFRNVEVIARSRCSENNCYEIFKKCLENARLFCKRLLTKRDLTIVFFVGILPKFSYQIFFRAAWQFPKIAMLYYFVYARGFF